MSIKGLTVGVTASAVLALVVGPLSTESAAAAAPVAASCGAVLTSDAYLKSDLICPGDGVKLAGDLTFDLKGHRLIGSGGGVGITVSGIHSVQVRNGRIQHWETGLQAPIPDTYDGEPTVRKVDVLTVRFDHNVNGLDTTNGYPYLSAITTNFSAVGSTFDHNTVAVGGVFTGNTRISHSLFTSNFRGVTGNSGKISVYKSWLQDNDQGVACFEGVANVECVVSATRLKNNKTALWFQSAAIGSSTGNLITGSEVGINAAIGIAAASGTTFVDNQIAVRFVATSGTLTNNTFTRNGVGFTAVNDFEEVTATLTGNTFSRNRDGIYIGADVLGISLKSNTAVKNTRWGIYAPSATDLGGNKASGNGMSPQCVGVAC